MRSRDTVRAKEQPHFITSTIDGWLPIFIVGSGGRSYYRHSAMPWPESYLPKLAAPESDLESQSPRFESETVQFELNQPGRELDQPLNEFDPPQL